jgi:hypothetical protein
MANLNARPNNYRRVSYAEHEEMHLFKVMRHFPELAKTLPEVHEMQVKAGRNWEDQSKPGKVKPRDISFRSTRRLDSLKSSVHGTSAGGQMDEMRKVLLCSRNPAMAKRLAESSATPYLENGSISTNPSRSPTRSVRVAPPVMSPGLQSGEYKLDGNGTIGLLEDSQTRGPESKVLGGNASGALDNSVVSTEKFDKYGNLLSVDPLESANLKLAKASVSYAPTGEVNILAGFQGQDLNAEEFDVQLKRCLQVNLNKKELAAMFASMDADGSGLIDGVEFTRYFLTIGNIAREKVRLETLEKHRRDAHREMQHAKEEEARIKEWEKSQVSHDTTDDDEKRVFKKLAKVALHWDNGSNVAAAKLVGFDAYLTPYEFKAQLEASFDLYLEKEEIGALMKRYKNRAGEYCVDGKAFLQSFSTLRRTARAQHQKDLKKFADRKDKVLKLGKYYSDTGYQCLGR